MYAVFPRTYLLTSHTLTTCHTLTYFTMHQFVVICAKYGERAHTYPCVQDTCSYKGHYEKYSEFLDYMQ